MVEKTVVQGIIVQEILLEDPKNEKTVVKGSTIQDTVNKIFEVV